MLIRLARQAELALGQMVEKESHGIKLLLVRHPQTGDVSVMDAHCFHMGAALVGGDIEDFGDGKMCVVCPAHKYKIDVKSGHQVDSDLCGTCRVSPDQKQRTYKVHLDSDFIWVEIPEVKTPTLPSDYYNQQSLTMPEQFSNPSTQQQRGLFGPPTAVPTQGLQPYAGTSSWPVVQQQAQQQQDGDSLMDPPLQLSQEAAAAPMEQQAAAAPQSMGRLSFPTMKMDAPHVARRKAATAAILKRSYQPPVAAAPAPQALPPQTFAASAGPPVIKQQTLFESWGMAANQSTAAVGGADSMDMN